MISSDQIDILFSSTTYSSSGYDNLSASALGRGIDSYTNSDYDGAVREFKRSIALSPNSSYGSQAFEFLAQTYVVQNKADEAIKTYKQMIKIDPTNDSAHLNLGNLYFKSGDYKSAEQEYSLAVRINANSANNRFALGMTYQATGRYDAAVSQFKRVVQLAPADPNAYDALGQALHKLNRNDEAIVQFKKAVSLDKKYTDAYLDLGYTYADLKKPDEAQKEVDILSGLDQTKADELTQYLKDTADPKITLAFSTSGFPLNAGRNTVVASMDDALVNPGGHKDYTINFMFSKDMDPSSVQNPLNWQINRAAVTTPGGPYNLGLPLRSTEIAPPTMPYKVIYDPGSRLAQITFRITQNATGDGTLDPSHLVFKFNGVDANGNSMDTSADEFSSVSKIV